MKRVVVGLSGGVDSSVAAYLLKEQGYEVIAMFMKNWHDTSVTISDECPWIDDSNDAMLVAQKLGIPFQTIDLSEQYKERIVDYMFKEYEEGRTPNPDVLCNREIKFDVFLEAAKELNADYVATGHYCRKDSFEKDGKTIFRLLAGKDQNKDQSYFLCQLNQAQLGKALFPIGDLEKPEVRRIAAELDLVTADKKDSQGLCFIGKVKLPDFLQQQLKAKTGNIIEVERDDEVFNSNVKALHVEENLLEISDKFHYSEDKGKVLGEHQGAHYFTVGQRKGLKVGGTPLPLFVLETDTINNVIYTGQGSDHPGLNRFALRVLPDDIHWLRDDLALKPGESEDYLARIRYRQDLVKTKLYRRDDFLFVVFEKAQIGIASGQFVAWYKEDELIGSGVIQ